jgi:hypothetical protein
MVICTQNSGLDPDNKQKMLRLYPNLDYTELTTCGHFIHMEQPEMFNNKLKAFIASQIKNKQAYEVKNLFEKSTEDYRRSALPLGSSKNFGNADVKTFCQIFDHLSETGITDPAEFIVMVLWSI